MIRMPVAVLLPVLLLSANPVAAQRSPPDMGARTNLNLLKRSSVIAELKLTTDEIANIPLLAKELAAGEKKFAEKYEAAAQAERSEFLRARLREVEKLLVETFGAAKAKRLRQIRWQLMGLYESLREDPVREELGWTDDRAEMLRGFLKQAGRAAFRSGVTFEDMPRYLAGVGEQQVDAMLTAEQKAKWKGLQGDPFKFDFTREEIRDGVPAQAAPRKAGGSKDAKPAPDKGKKDAA